MEPLKPNRVVASGAGSIAVGHGITNSSLTTYVTNIAGLGSDPAVSPERLASIPYLPLGDKFTGRANILEGISEELIAGQASVLAQPSALYADGGIGKTTLALELAWRLYDEKRFQYVFFLNASSRESLHASLAELCAPDPRGSLPSLANQRCEAVLHWLQDRSQDAPILLIFDNADATDARAAVREFLPKLAHCARLVTSRHATWPDLSAYELQLFSPAEAIEFLRSRLGTAYCDRQGSETALAKIALAVDHLPLALEIVAAYLRRTRQSTEDWITEWTNHPQNTLVHYDADRIRYPDSLARAWERSFAELSSEAKELLSVFAWIAPRPDNFDLTTIKGLPSWQKVRLILAELSDASLISWPLGADEISIHRVLQAVCQHRMSDEERTASRQGTLTLLHTILPELVWTEKGWRDWEKLSPHLSKVLDTEDDRVMAKMGWSVAQQYAQWLHEQARYAEAEPLFRRTLAIIENYISSDNPVLATSLNNLAGVLLETDRQTEAEPLLRRALAINEKHFGEDMNVAVSLNNLGRLLQTRDRLDEAEPLFRRCLVISEKCQENDNPNVARTLNNLGNLLRATNRLSEAEILIRQALDINERIFGNNHPRVAEDLSSLAVVLKDTNQVVEAEVLQRKALAIDEETLGAEHPNIASRLSNLAMLLKETGRLDEAEPLIRRALAVDEKSYGGEHSTVAIRLNNLAMLLQKLNRFDEAEPLFRRALAISENSQGDDHAAVAIRLNNLALLLQDTNRFAEAEPLFRRALAITEKSLGNKHPTVANRLRNIGLLMRDTNRLSKSESYFRKAVEILALSNRMNDYVHPLFNTALKDYVNALQALHIQESEISVRVAKAQKKFKGLKL